jgi:hypothetical protein
MDLDTSSIPKSWVNPRSYRQQIYDKDGSQPVLTGNGPEDAQLRDHIRSMNQLEAYTPRVVVPQRERLQHKSINERELFLHKLQQKHQSLPGAYKAQSGRRRHHYNPEPQGVERDFEPLLGNFESILPGDVVNDRERRRVRNAKYKAYDGRIDSNGQVVSTGAHGMFDSAQESPYEAFRSGRQTERVKKDIAALNMMRNINETPGRVVSVQWQGPSAVHRDTSESAAIPRRSVDTRGRTHIDGGNFYNAPYKPPENTVMSIVQDTRIAPGRREVTGTMFKQERPLIENITHSKQRTRFHELRTPNADSSSFTGSSLVFGNRSEQLITTSAPDLPNGPQRTNWAVSENRAMRQFKTDTDFERDRELDTSAYNSKHKQNWQQEKAYQRHQKGDQVLNKTIVEGRNPQILRNYAPYERNIVMRRL